MEFIPRISPRWQAPLHLKPYIDVLERAPGGNLRVVFAAPPQHGKPLHVDMLVTMSDGSRKPIGLVRIGDKVVSGLGRVTRVTAVYDQGELDVVRIRLRSGRAITAERTHRFLTQDGWKQAGELRVYDAQAWQRPRGDSLMLLASQPMLQSTSVGGVPTARLLGYMLGDGNTTQSNARFTNVEPLVREQFENAVSAFDSVVRQDDAQTLRIANGDPRRTHEEVRAYRTAFERARRSGTERPKMPRRRHRVRELLAQHGMTGCNAHQKRVPPAMFRAPADEVAAFIAAYFECDGTRAARNAAGRAGQQSAFYSVSRDLLSGVQTLLGRLGIRTNLYQKRGRYNGAVHLSWQLSVLDDARFFDLIPVVGKKSGASDRSRRYESADIHLRDTVVAVEPAGRARCVCITVAQDACFVAEDIVTHNTESTIHAFSWWLLKYAYLRYAYATYSGDRAQRVGARALRIADRAGVLFSTANTGLWQTPSDGQVLWTSVGGGMTGEPVDGVIVIDDPLKDRKEAESPTIRENHKDWWHGTVESRLHPGASVIVMATRWHGDDLSGYLVREQGFDYINLKAIADEERPEGDVREPGQALWGEHHPLDTLIQKREANIWNFSSLFQGEPRPKGGALFKQPHYYAELPKDGFRIICGVDLAYSERTHADYSVCVEIWVVAPLPQRGVTHEPKDYLFYIVDVQRKQVEAPMFTLTLKAKQSSHGSCKFYWYAAGTEAGSASFIKSKGISLIVMDTRGRDKFTRAQVTCELWNLGRILVPEDSEKYPWADSFIDEVTSFTGVKDPQDDQPDALVSGIDAALLHTDDLGILGSGGRYS